MQGALRRSTVSDAVKRSADRVSYCAALSDLGDRTLLHVVEIRFAQNALRYLLARMRTWLDQQGSQPSTFRYSFDEPDVVLHVDFAVGAEADAFARAFGGKVLP
jgi:hypothetical protein